jgi:hypothetical protein
MDPLQGNAIRALHLDLFFILQPVASSPAGAALCLLPHVATSLHFKDINDPNPLEHDSASTSEVLTVLQSLDWAPLVALQTATPDAELADLAALSLESGGSDTGADVCARRWPAHVDALQQLLQTPPKKAPQWLSKPPRQLYAALLSTCNDAHAEPLAARILRGFQQPPGDELYTTVADALNDPVVHSYTMHPAHVIMRSTMIDVLRQDPLPGQQPPSPCSFVQQHLTFGLNFYTVTQKDAQKAADAAASPRQPGILMRKPQGMMCRMGLELRPEQADGEQALFAPMQCLEGAARLLNWYELVPPRR